MLSLWLIAASANAQSVGALQAPGANGIALGEESDARLHLGADAGVGFDTNPYTTPLATGDFTGDVTARVRPYVEANLPGAALSLRGRASFDYGFLPGVVDPETRAFLLYQGQGSGDLTWNRGGAMEFTVGDSVSLHTDPGVVALGTLLSRVNNQVRAGVGMTPGGGTLRLRFGFTNTIVHFFAAEDTDSVLLRDGLLDSMSNVLSARADYRFLPKTGLFADARAGWTTYPFARREVPQALPVALRIGLQGQLLTKLSALATIGYENPLVIDANGLQTGALVGVVGQVEAQWQPTTTTSFAAGFRRNFDAVALYQYIGQNRVYAAGSALIGVTSVALGAAWTLVEYGNEATGGQRLTDRETGRVDHAITGNLVAQYFVLPWLAIGVSDVLDWRITNASDISGVGARPTNLSYLRNETLFLASVRY